MKTINVLSATLCFGLLSGCTSLDKTRDEYETLRKKPIGKIYKSISNFSKELKCMDDLMVKYNIKDVGVMVEDIADRTEEVKAGAKDMLISAISEMTTESHGIRLVAYGKDTPNAITFLKRANNLSPYKNVPPYDIRGSISQFDKKVVHEDGSLGLFSRREGGLGASNVSSVSILAMDLNVIKTDDLSVVPGVTSKNSISIYRQGRSLDADARIDKYGVYFDMNLSRSEGVAQALRNLVELASIELVGKLTRVPYWTCLGVDANDPDMQLELRNWQRLTPTLPDESSA
ncbi:MAG: Unknown protein [uncultured Thiotrichaceae bacterium]|uniref:Lipoprotein n=1 Tax=uncultured Thiotrichaceae bacterium TaxID=298394 RepID=A0A6S6T0L0_9GAMM|nr:MAG: Unknown protein [uncultured Thiotrichaceae bacterium]